MYNITARRMISGLVLKYLNEAGLVIGRSYATVLPRSSRVILTRPPEELERYFAGHRLAGLPELCYVWHESEPALGYDPICLRFDGFASNFEHFTAAKV